MKYLFWGTVTEINFLTHKFTKPKSQSKQREHRDGLKGSFQWPESFGTVSSDGRIMNDSFMINWSQGNLERGKRMKNQICFVPFGSWISRMNDQIRMLLRIICLVRQKDRNSILFRIICSLSLITDKKQTHKLTRMTVIKVMCNLVLRNCFTLTFYTKYSSPPPFPPPE